MRRARRPPRGSSPPWPGTWAGTAARHRWPTPSKGPSSSPAPPSSGCATASGSSPSRRRSVLWPPGSTPPTGSMSSPPSPGSGAPGGTPTPGGPSPGSPGAWARAHIARAVVEAMAFQVRDVVDAMTGAGGAVSALRGRRRGVGDGPPPAAPGRPDPGAGRTAGHGRDHRPRRRLVGRPGRGGLGIARRPRRPWSVEGHFTPVASAVAADAAHAGWRRAVERSARLGSGLIAGRRHHGRVGQGVGHEVGGQPGHHLDDLVVLLR